MDVMTVLAGIGKSAELLKTMRNVEKNFDAATYKGQIAELMETLSDAKMALVDAREELAAKEKEVAALKEIGRKRREETVIVFGLRYEKGSDGGAVGIPFCDRCDVIDGKLIRLALTNPKDGRKFMCPECKADYGARVNTYGYPVPGTNLTMMPE